MKKVRFIFIIAVIARLIYSILIWSSVCKSPYETMSVMYVRSAFGILIGDGYSQYKPGSEAYNDLNLKVIEPAKKGVSINNLLNEDLSKNGVYLETLHPPGWSIVAAFLTKYTGTNMWKGMQVLTSLVDALCIFLLFRLFALFSFPTFITNATLWFYALFPPILYNAVTVKPTGFILFFILSISLLFYKYYKLGELKWFLIAALLNGIATLFRAEYLLFLPFLCLLFTGAYVKRINIKTSFIYIGRPILAIALSIFILSPWGLRNLKHFDKFIITSSGAGCTLVTGLGTYPNPWGFGPSDLDRHKESLEAGYTGAFVLEADVFFKDKFFNAIKSNPAAYLKILGRRMIAGLVPAYSWGLVRDKGVSYTKSRSSGKLPKVLSSTFLKNYWSDLISAFLVIPGHLGLILMLFKHQDRSAVGFLFLAYLYSLLVHVLTVLVAPFYMIPTIYVQLIGFAYFIYFIREQWLSRKRSILN